MAMRTLGEALESALASMLNAGEEGTAIPSVSRKEAGTEKAPASVGGNNEQRGRNHSVKSAMDATQPGKAPASRANGTGSPVHSPAQPQRRTGRPLPFRVIEGGRPAQGGGVKPGGLRTDPVEVRARELGLVVHAATREASI